MTMAKVQSVKAAKSTNGEVKGLTAATYSNGGRKGKPSRPKGMPDAEWWKVLANGRVPKMLKSMRAVARLASVENGEYTEKQAARILRDAREALQAIEQAFANPEKPVKAPTSRYFQ